MTKSRITYEDGSILESPKLVKTVETVEVKFEFDGAEYETPEEAESAKIASMPVEEVPVEPVAVPGVKPMESVLDRTDIIKK
jgi:hypothetical protein